MMIWLMLVLLLPRLAMAAENYPKIANYYLNFFSTKDYAALSKYDLLILQPEMGISQGRFWQQYRKSKPDGKLLAYLYPASFYREALFYDQFGVRRQLFKEISCEDWWLRDTSGEVISSWPQMSVVNLTKKDWQEYNLKHLISSYNLAKRWDGVMWDLVDSKLSCYSTEPIDLAENKVCGLATNNIDQEWQSAMADFLALARAKMPKKIMLINGDSLPAWQSKINGRIFEHFPTPWEGTGTWQASMKQYLRALPRLNQAPQVYVLNTRYEDNGVSRNQQMRFGLASTLLGDGYFAFDSGAESHSQLWWFDEYDLKLGKPLAPASNLTGSTALVAPGLWWREFEKGAVLVNSSKITQKTTLPTGIYKRISGLQDKIVNNGQAVTEIEIKPMDALVLVKK
jgi:hypothetical protein